MSSTLNKKTLVRILPTLQVSCGIFILFSLVSFCIKSDIKLFEATSQVNKSGIKGGISSVEYYFKLKILTNENIEFDSLWINNKVFKPYLSNNKPSISNQAPVFLKNDTITLRVSDLQSKNFSISTPPIKYKGNALLRYKIKGNSHYWTIKKIKSVQGINRP